HLHGQADRADRQVVSAGAGGGSVSNAGRPHGVRQARGEAMTTPMDQGQIEAMLKGSPFISFLGLTVTALDADKQEIVMRSPMRPEFEREPGTKQWHGG